MKRRSLVLIGVTVAVVLALFLVGVVFGLGVLIPPDRSEIAYITSFSVTVLVLLPAIAGVLMARPTFDPNGRGGREALRGFVRVFWVGEVIAAAVCLGVAVIVPEIALALVVVVALSMGFLAAAIRIGRRFPAPPGAVEAPLPTVPRWSRSLVRRKVATIVLTGVLGSGIAITGLVALDDEIPPGEAVLLGVALGLLAAGVSAMVVAWPLARSSSRALGRSFADQSMIPRVVLGGKRLELSEDSVRRAVTYARISALSLPFQLGQLILLAGGIWLLSLSRLGDGSGTDESVMTVAPVILFPVVVLVATPVTIVQARRARRYAAAHAPVPTAADGTAGDVRPG
ncbi:hypothetical protein ACFDTO_00470 [Microbacteriaceae bacterium 4G12]